MTRSLCVALAAAACSPSSPPAAPPGNVAAVAPTVGPALQLAPGEPLGSLGLAPASTAASWLPVDTHAVVAPGASVPAGTQVRAIASAGGAPVQLVASKATRVPYGCDANALDVVPFDGPALAPGVVWLLPPSAAWTPAALPITARTTPTTARYTLGPLALDLVRDQPTRGTLTLTRDGHPVYTAPFERGDMAGAPTTPLDLTTDEPGIPQPVGAWALAPAGPFLVVLRQPGFEGTTLQPLLVEGDHTREVEAMTLYLYRCAF